MGAPANAIQDLGKLCLRLTVGGNLLLHGIHKLRNGIPYIHDMVAAKGLPDALSYGVYIGEVLGPLLVIIGLLSRAGAAFMAISMGFAIFLAKLPHAGELGPQGGWALELDTLYLLGAFAVLFLGAGRFSLSRGRDALD